jgi:hypothetical protein
LSRSAAGGDHGRGFPIHPLRHDHLRRRKSITQRGDQCDATVLSDAANAAKPQSSALGSSVKPQDLVFPTNIQVPQRSINIDGKDVALIPGMGVSVENKTRRRRAIDYLLSPSWEIAARAGSER